MVVIAVIGILAAIGIPAYSDYLTRGRVPDATAALASKQVKMEQYFQDNRTYVGAPASICPDTTSGKYFNFSCAPASTATTYTLVATGKGPMSGFVYTVDKNNANTTTITTKPVWLAHTPNDCWVTKKGGMC
jgi:type IV pilus assembly protein PilE